MTAFPITLTRAAPLIFLFASGVSHAADVAGANYQPGPADGPAWLSTVAGVKLVAVDGSTMMLSPAEGGLSLALVAPNGAAQKSTFAFLSDKLGTISDDSDIGHVTGFFRETDAGLEAQFADGRTESLVTNASGGISLTIHTSSGGSSCMPWYPPDHVFGTSEKRAALAAYADRLGISDHGKSPPHGISLCAPAARVARAKDQPATTHTATPLMTISHPVTMLHVSDTAIKGSGIGALVPVVVRNSEVHLIDGVASTSPAGSPPKSSARMPSVTQSPALQIAQASLQQSAPVSAVQTAAPAHPAASAPAGSGASECLSVETNGADVGFRNHCAFGVQFAYCLQKASDPADACDAGAKTGAVVANGFAVVLQDAGIKSAEAEHDFRWVACSGNTNDVVAHLDRADPPAGRCVRANAS